jgi:tRNA(fMet)-specific endonuclease VapC
MSLYVLDTDHLSLHQAGYEPLRVHFLNIPPEQIAITIVSVEEVLRGRLAQVSRATKPQERVVAYHWLHRTLEFLHDFAVLKFDVQAEAYFQALREQRIRIGTQDLMIAAIALRQRATVVTRNEKDFGRVPGLKVEDWSRG